MKRCVQRALTAAAVLLAAMVLFLAFAPQGQTVVKTALFVTQVVPALPSITWLQSGPVHERTEIETPEGVRSVDIYRPEGEGPYAGTVVFLGVAPAGADDPRVINLGQALARANMATLIYWSPEKAQKEIHAPDIHNLVTAFKYLRSRDYVDAERVGIAGFSVGGSFALMAAAQEEIRGEVDYVNAFGAYYDLKDVIAAIGSRTRARLDEAGRDERMPWAVNSLTLEVATKLLLESLPSHSEAEQIREALAEGRGLGQHELSQAGYAVYRILAGGSFAEIEPLVGDLPDGLLDRVERVSPKNYVDDVGAPVLLMHDRADDLIPPEESRKLNAALVNVVDVKYTEFSLFSHVDPSRSLGAIDQARELNKLLWHVYAILRRAS